MRRRQSGYLFRAGRLFQECILHAFVNIEYQRLMWMRQNQKHLRADTYKNIRDAVDECNNRDPTDSLYGENEVGVGRKVLASSYIGSPRWYNNKFLDAMAIVRHFHKPDLFITMTCNPNWPEIKNNLKPGETIQNRPDLVARVFKLKKEQFLDDIIKGKIFGESIAHLWVIEHQK